MLWKYYEKNIIDATFLIKNINIYIYIIVNVVWNLKNIDELIFEKDGEFVGKYIWKNEQVKGKNHYSFSK